MKKLEILLNVYKYNDLQELNKDDKRLVENAIKAAHNAYAPYSHFHVGAAVLLENGQIITGNNQENAAYPSGLCAERVALFAANSQFPDIAVAAIAIVAIKDGKVLETAVAPCGSCRQVMIETEVRFERPIRIILYGKKSILVINSVKELMPLSFTASELNS